MAPHTSSVHHHPLNPETKDAAVLFFIDAANRDFAKALSVHRSAEQRAHSARMASDMMGLACVRAEEAATFRGHRFSPLPAAMAKVA